jgi:hypothetical protein
MVHGGLCKKQSVISKNVCLEDILKGICCKKTSGSSRTLNIFIRGGQLRNFGVLGHLFACIKSLGNVTADKFY